MSVKARPVPNGASEVDSTNTGAVQGEHLRATNGSAGDWSTDRQALRARVISPALAGANQDRPAAADCGGRGVGGGNGEAISPDGQRIAVRAQSDAGDGRRCGEVSKVKPLML